MDGRLSIGRVAALYGVSHDALRLYDKRGLVVPEVDHDTGYRSYTLEHLGLLDTVMLGRATRTPLKRVKRALDSESLDEYAALYSEQLDSLAKQMAELKRAEGTLLRLSGLAERARRVEEQGAVPGVLGREVVLRCHSVNDVLASAQREAPAVDTPEYLRLSIGLDGSVHEDEERTYFEEPTAVACDVAEGLVLLDESCPTLQVWGALAALREAAAPLLRSKGAVVYARFEYSLSHADGYHEYLCTLVQATKRPCPS